MTIKVTELTNLLNAWGEGDEKAQEQLIPIIYDELRKLASSYLNRERLNPLLQTTALVHETYIKLIDAKSVKWQNRAHFFGVCARLMRQILVDHYRNDNRYKRGGNHIKISLEQVTEMATQKPVDLIELDDALQLLEKVDPRQSQIIEMHFFGGLTHEEIGEVLHLNSRTIKREWSAARAWLLCELEKF